MYHQRIFKTYPFITLIVIGLLAGTFWLLTTQTLTAVAAPTADACWATIDGITVYSSTDASAVRSAVAAAGSSAAVKVAGTCTGVAAQGGTYQVVYINKNLTLTGGYTMTNWLVAPDSATYPTVLDAVGGGRVVYVTNNANFTLSHLTLRNGDPGGSINLGGAVYLDSSTTTAISNSRIEDSQTNFLGGGIYNNGDLTLANSTVSGNRSVSYDGGGIYNSGTITVTASTFLSNAASGNGGGLYSGGAVTFSGNTFSGNTTNYNGGGLYNGGPMSGYNNTFSNNSAGYQGGGLYSVSSATSNQVSYSTFSGNSAVTSGGGVYGDSGLQLYGVIVANSPAGGDCASVNAVSDAVRDGGYNLIEDGSCLAVGSSLSGDPLLDPLADNGGQTQTHALQNGSPALVRIPAVSCTPTTDQRGTSRPQFSLCDIGAYENSTDFPPIAVDDIYTATEDVALVVAALGVLSNDIESNDQSMNATLQADVSHGTLSLNSNGSFVYTPTLNFNGSDSFTYIVSDGSQIDTGQVTLNVIAINDPPVATDDSYTTGENVSLTGNVINDDTGSGSDSDPDGDTFIANLAADVITGDLTLNEDGSFTYLPSLGWTGPVTFTYWLTDSDGATTFPSLDFDGVNDYLATASMNNGNAMTFEAWVRPGEIRTTAQQIYNGGGPPKMVVEINGSGAGGTWEGRVYDGSGTVGQIFGPAAVPGQWTHVAYVYDYSSNLAELFINGVSAGTATAPSAITHSSSRTLGAISTGNVEFLKGRLAEVRLWNTARTEVQIQANMNQAVDPGDSDLLAYYHMADGGYGSSTAVDSANGYHATLINMDPTTAWIAPGASNVATVTITVNPVRCWVEHTGDQYADYGSWDGSAVQTAINQASAGDTLKIAGTCAGVQTVNTETQVAYVNKSLTLSGGYTYTNWLAPADPQTHPTIFDAEGNGRVIFMGGSYNVTLSGLTLQNGQSASFGGGLKLQGVFTITNSIIQNNTVIPSLPNLGGGGIYVTGGSQGYIEGTIIADNHAQSFLLGGGVYSRNSVVTISNSSVYSNTTADSGGGLYAREGELTIVNTSIYYNTAANAGGGMHLSHSAQGSIVNSTLSQNNASSGGGVSNSSSSLSLAHTTFFGNVAPTGGALYNDGGTLTMTANILAGSGNDCSGAAFVSGDYNLSDDASCNLNAAHDQPNTYPLLAPLADNGGDTPTHALYKTSPAMNAIPAGSCSETEDQRGVSRPQFGSCDIGAFENATDFAPVAVSDAYTTGESIPLTVGTATGVLSNDMEYNDQSLSASLDTDVSHGSLTLNSDGSFVYTPTFNYDGSDSFIYIVSDGSLSDTAQVTLNIIPNDPPVATDDNYTTIEDGSVSGNVITDDTGNGSDSDPENGSLSASLQTDVVSGTLALSADGSFVYTPMLNINGTDTFTYILSDGILTDTAVVTLTITPVNDLPVATDDVYLTTDTLVLTGNVITDDTGNGPDSDADNDPLSASLKTDVISGTLLLNSDGSFVYTPTLNLLGADGFEYYLSSGANGAPAAAAYWPLEEGSGSTTADASGNGHDGTLNNGPFWTSNTPNTAFANNYALGFDGVDDVITVPDSYDINDNPDGYPARTVSAWFKTDDVTINTRKQVIWEEGGTTNGLAIYLYDGALYAGAWSETNNWTGTWLSTMAVTSGQWYQVALVLDSGSTTGPEANALRLYLDGAMVSSGAGAKLSQHILDIGIGDLVGDTHFHDGTVSGSGGHTFAGTIDDVRIHNLALSQTEVQATMNALPGWDSAQVTINLYSTGGCFVEADGDNRLDYGSADASALQAAVNAATASDTLKIAGTCAGVEKTGSFTQTLYINKNLTLIGGYTPANWLAAPDAFANPTTLDAQGNGRVLYIASGVSAAVDGLTITGGDAGVNTNGSGIYVANNATLELNRSAVVSNTSTYKGAGLYNWGTVTVTQSIFAHNQGNDGGAMANYGVLTVIDTALYDNHVTSDGGALQNFYKATFINSTLSGNQAAADGGAIEHWNGTLELIHTTLADNQGGYGNGIYVNQVMTATNTIFDNGTTNCHYGAGVFNDGGYNIESANTCGLSATGSMTNTNPILDALADNGGQTQTHALLLGSPALNAIPVGSCILSTDQRGVTRPYGDGCDIGAYEKNVNDPPIATADSYTTAEDTPVSGNVISDDTGNGSDSDADNDPLSASLKTDVISGTLLLNSDGSFVYTPTIGFIGTDVFEYYLSDGVHGAPAAAAYWPFEEGSGSTTADASGNGHDGTLNNGPFWTSNTPNTAFANNYALGFDGVDDVITVPDSYDINGNPDGYPARTVTAWFKADDVTINTRKQVIWEEGGTTDGLAIYLYDGALYAGAWSETNNWTGTWLSTTAVTSGQWYHVALVLDSDSTTGPEANALRLYLDGAMVSSGAGAKLAQHILDIGIGDMVGDTHFHDGTVSGSGGHTFAGTIDDVRIHNLALLQTEVQATMNALPGWDSAQVTINVFEASNLSVTATLQGRTAYTATHTLNFYTSGTMTPTLTVTATANAAGNFVLTNLVPGTYTVTTKTDGYLQAAQVVTLTAGTTAVDFGELLAGDANGDNIVNILDLSILAGAYNASKGSPTFDARADFNGDGIVNILDLSLMSSNYNMSGEGA